MGKRGRRERRKSSEWMYERLDLPSCCRCPRCGYTIINPVRPCKELDCPDCMRHMEGWVVMVNIRCKKCGVYSHFKTLSHIKNHKLVCSKCGASLIEGRTYEMPKRRRRRKRYDI